MIHPTVIVHPSAQIGRNVDIGPYSVLGPDVILQDGCRLGSHVVMEHAELGADCQVYPYVSLGFAPQHLGDKGENTHFKAGARNIFREYVTIHRGTQIDKALTQVGNDCFFMAYAHVAHDCQIGNNVILANSAQLAGHTIVNDHVFISTMVGLHQFVRVGSGALVSGGAMVSLDVAPFCIAQGDRASLKGLNVVGLRRRGVNRATMQLIKAAYKTTFLSNLPLKEALEHPSLNVESDHIAIFRNFLKSTKRGITRPALNVAAEEKEEVVS